MSRSRRRRTTRASSRRRAAARGGVKAHHLVIAGLVVGLVWSITRKPIQTQSRVEIDWTGKAIEDLTRIGVLDRIRQRDPRSIIVD